MNAKNNDERSELLSAYLDGEVSAAETARVEQWLHTDESARRLFDELRATAGLVSSLPRRAAPGSIAEDVRTRRERHELLGDAPDRLPRRRRRWPVVRAVFSIAAVLGVVVVAGLYIATDRDRKPALPPEVRHAVTGREPSPNDAALSARRNAKTARRRARKRDESDRAIGDTSPTDTERVVMQDGAHATRRGADGAPPTRHTADTDATSRPSPSALGHTVVVKRPTPSRAPIKSSGRGSLIEVTPPRDALVLAVTVHSEAARNALIDALSTRYADVVIDATAPPSPPQPLAGDAIAQGAAAGGSKRRHRPRLEQSTLLRSGSPPSIPPRKGERPGKGRYTKTDSTVTEAPGAAARHRQVALRVALRSLSAVVTAIDARLERGDMNLEAGPLHITGRARVRRMIGVIAAPPTPSIVSEIDEDKHGATGAFPTTWRDLLEALGVNPAVVASLTERADAPVRGGRPTGRAVRQPLVGPPDPTGTKAPTERYAGGTEPSELDLTRPTPLRPWADGSDTISEPGEGGPPTSDVPRNADARSSLVARRMSALRHKRVDEEPNAGTVADADAEGRSPDGNTPRVTPAARSGSGSAQSSHAEGPTVDASIEQVVTLIVRIEVDPSIGPAVGTKVPSRTRGARDARHPPRPKPKPIKVPPGKPANPDARDRNKSNSSSLKY